MHFYVYLLFNKEHDKFYIGQTRDIDIRVLEHNSGLSAYTAKYSGTWTLVYSEMYNTRAEAMQREKFLKKQKSKPFYKKLSGIDGSAG